MVVSAQICLSCRCADVYHYVGCLGRTEVPVPRRIMPKMSVITMITIMQTMSTILDSDITKIMTMILTIRMIMVKSNSKHC